MTDHELSQEIKRIECKADTEDYALGPNLTTIHHAVLHRDNKWYLYKESVSKSILFLGVFSFRECLEELRKAGHNDTPSQQNFIRFMKFGEIHTFVTVLKSGQKQPS